MGSSLSCIRSAVILAAGRGKRLGPRTKDLPKPMIPLHGKPILDYILSNLATVGIEKVLLVVGYQHEQIRSEYACGSKYGLTISFIQQNDTNGTGSATLLSREFAQDKPFFLGWGDSLATIDEFKKLFATFEKTQPEAVMMLNHVKNTQQGAAVEMESGKIVSIIEKPKTPKPGWNQAGMAIYRPSIFTYLEKLSLSTRGELEFTDAVRGLINSGASVVGIPMVTRRLHLSTIADIDRIEKDIEADSRYRQNIAE